MLARRRRNGRPTAGILQILPVSAAAAPCMATATTAGVSAAARLATPGAAATAVATVITPAVEVVIPIIPAMVTATDIHIPAVGTVPAVIITRVCSVPIIGSAAGHAAAGNQGDAAQQTQQTNAKNRFHIGSFGEIRGRLHCEIWNLAPFRKSACSAGLISAYNTRIV
jgi:hypothetical protein